jgi:hypothetical protein
MTSGRRFVVSSALLVYMITAAAAVLGGQAPETAHPSPAATPPTPAPKPAAAKPPDITTIVERIQQRIDAEVGKPAAVRAAAASRKPAPRSPESTKTTTPSDRRIRLSWRIQLIWPTELTATP